MAERPCCDCGKPVQSQYAEWCDECGGVRSSHRGMKPRTPPEPRTPPTPPESCSKCRAPLPRTPEHFNHLARSPDGLDYWCKGCRRCARQESYQRNRRAEPQHLTPKDKWRGYRNGARQQDLAWGLTWEQFMGLWQLPCHYCGSEILTIGLDRVDNDRGYLIENVVPCCPACHRMKRGVSTRSWLRQIRRIERHCRNFDVAGSAFGNQGLELGRDNDYNW